MEALDSLCVSLVRISTRRLSTSEVDSALVSHWLQCGEGDIPPRVVLSVDHLTSQQAKSPIATITIPKTIDVIASASIIKFASGSCAALQKRPL